MVYSNIVKVLEEQENSYGTGIVIAEDKVLTMEHVVRGKTLICISWDDQDYSATVEFRILLIIGLYEKIFFAALSFVSLPFKVLIVVEILFFTFMRYSRK